jgi:pimeloyl-ACP methyl ester carboxylesterase
MVIPAPLERLMFRVRSCSTSYFEHVDRRRLLGGLGAATLLSLLSGCNEDQIKKILDTCPSDPAVSAGINWVPDVGHPVFWGAQNITTANGAPRSMMIYYPSIEGTTEAPPMLQLCIFRWPVVLFLHGQPPSTSTESYYQRWSHLGSVLARCGYVVVIPDYEPVTPGNDYGPAITAAMADVNWVRTGWADAKWVDPRPDATAVAGHSYGAILAAKAAAAHPEIGALVSLSGGYHEFHPALPVLQAVHAPSLFTWAVDGTQLTLLAEENLDMPDPLWDQLTQPKYAAVYKGEHFDYLATADADGAARGPCSLIGPVAADLAALFISANVPVANSRTRVSVDLKPPQEEQSQKQQSFLGGHLSGLKQFQTKSGCTLNLRWKVGGATGSRHLGP